MNLLLLLEMAVGEIRKDVIAPPTTLEWELEYLHATPTINAILDVLDMVEKLPDLPRYQIIDVPFGESYNRTVYYLTRATASDYRKVIPTKPMVVSEWMRTNSSDVSMNTIIRELRVILFTHIKRDIVHPRLDDYLFVYFKTLIKSILRAHGKSGLWREL